MKTKVWIKKIDFHIGTCIDFLYEKNSKIVSLKKM